MIARLFGLALALLIAAPAAAAAPAGQVVNLWPGTPPGGPGPGGAEKIGAEGSAQGSYSNIQVPRMEVYRPAHPTGAAALVIGGGGYFRIQIGSAARPAARFLADHGVTAFVLFYRLPADGWKADAPFQDGQRAMRLIRADAARYGIDPRRLGVVGFSAGAHLAGILATRGTQDFYPAIDAFDRQTAAPAFAGLIYPVVSLKPPIDTTRTRRELAAMPDAVDAFSVEGQVGPATPPVFLAQAADDPIADPRHSFRMWDAMHAAGRDVELHMFASGGHSFGIGKPGTLVAQWPELLMTWMRVHGWLSPPQ